MNTMTEKPIDKNVIDNALTYEEYTDLINGLYKVGKTTNDDNQESQLEYTKLNIHRSSKWDKRGKISAELSEKLKSFPFKMTWVIISEGWCGDSSQIIPFIQKMTEQTNQIEMKLLLRDKYPEVMDAFLTNGARSIPKLIALRSDTLEVIGEWGPRPKEAQERYLDERANPEIENKIATQNLHLWYARNKGEAIQQEFLLLLDEWKNH
jgi:hypothetical protein